MLCHISVSGHERSGVRRGGPADSSGPCIAHRSQPKHEPERNEEHHKGVVISQTPCGVRDVSGHEGDEPSGEHGSSLSKLVACHGSDGENRQGPVNRRQAKDAVPHGIGTQERLQQHGANGDGPGEERRTRVDATNGIEPVSIVHQMGIVRENVVHNPLHVPRV